MAYENNLFVEKYRPKTIEECVLPTAIHTMFSEIIQDKPENFPNMTMVGSAGIGKTTTARVLAEACGMHWHMINASEESGIDTLRTKVKRYASTRSLAGGMKLIILDEADNLSRQAQSALRGMIEEFSSNCRFILTCNYKNKIIDPILSRCPVVDFSIPVEEKEEMAIKIFNRICHILNEENITFEENTVVQVVMKNFPDYRRMIGVVQKYSRSGSLDSCVVSSTSADQEAFRNLMDIVKNKKFSEMRKWVTDHADVDMQTFYSDLNSYLWDGISNGTLGISKSSLAYIVTLIAEHTYKSNFIVDNQISMMAFLSLFMVEAEFE